MVILATAGQRNEAPMCVRSWRPPRPPWPMVTIAAIVLLWLE